MGEGRGPFPHKLLSSLDKGCTRRCQPFTFQGLRKCQSWSGSHRHPPHSLRNLEQRLETRWGWSEVLSGCRQLHQAAAIVEVNGGLRCEVGTRGIQYSPIVEGQCEILFKNLNKPILWSSISTLQRIISILQRPRMSFRAVFIFIKE